MFKLGDIVIIDPEMDEDSERVHNGPGWTSQMNFIRDQRLEGIVKAINDVTGSIIVEFSHPLKSLSLYSYKPDWLINISNQKEGEAIEAGSIIVAENKKENFKGILVLKNKIYKSWHPGAMIEYRAMLSQINNTQYIFRDGKLQKSQAEIRDPNPEEIELIKEELLKDGTSKQELNKILES